MAKKKSSANKAQSTNQSAEQANPETEDRGFSMDQAQAQAQGQDQAGSDEGLSYAEMMGQDPTHGDPSAPAGSPPPDAPPDAPQDTPDTGQAPEAPAENPDQQPAQVPAEAPPPRENPRDRDPDRPVSASELIHGSKGRGQPSPREAAHGQGPIEVTNERVTRAFQSAEPTAEQARAIELIRNRGAQLAQEILDKTPQCPDQSAAFRKVREAVDAAEDAILRRL